MEDKPFHKILEDDINEYVHFVYRISRNFPKEELFGSTSQLRRSALSVALNYIEGYARQRKAVLKNFLEISYGSLKESRYLLKFSYEEKFLSEEDYRKSIELSHKIGRMIWGILKRI